MSNHRPVLLRRNLIKYLLDNRIVIYEREEHRAVWFGRIMTFSDGQLACWQVLWDNFMRGNLPLPQGRVLLAWTGASTSVADLFKRHAAWKTIIVGDGRGNLWLAVPDEVFDEIEQPTLERAA